MKGRLWMRGSAEDEGKAGYGETARNVESVKMKGRLNMGKQQGMGVS